MFKSKRLTLTDGTCDIIENLRLTLEVFIGERIRIKRMQINLKSRTGELQFCCDTNNDTTAISFVVHENGDINFKKGYSVPIHCLAHFDKQGEVGIKVHDPLLNIGCQYYWIIGKSADERRTGTFGLEELSVDQQF